jgi:hypothetical protein
MIVRQKTGFFGDRTTVINTQTFECTIVTQREGFFRPFETVIQRGENGRGRAQSHVSGRIAYFPEFEKCDIKQLHEAIVQSLEDYGERGVPLGAAIEGVMSFVKHEGIASETINAEGWGTETPTP